MYLKHLRIDGFKSFADPVELTFPPGICAIVGPNGSGKSNITDALRFVLGEQRTSSMRSRRMDEIIFSGTKERGERGSAEVSLTLSDGWTENRISRKLYKTGESSYRINGKSVRLKDVQENFLDTGLGKNGYSLVSQGGIENIVLATPGELRTIVEEACGIAGFKQKKVETQRKLDKTRGNIERVRDILLEIEKQLSPLEKQAEKAKTYLRLQALLRRADLLLFLKERANQLEEKNALEASEKDASFTLLDAKKRSEEEDRKYVRLRERMTSLEEQRNLLVSEQERLQEQEKDCLQQTAQLREQLRHRSEDRLRLEQEKSNLLEEISRLQARTTERKAEIEALHALLSEKESFLSRIDTELSTEQERLTKIRLRTQRELQENRMRQSRRERTQEDLSRLQAEKARREQEILSLEKEREAILKTLHTREELVSEQTSLLLKQETQLIQAERDEEELTERTSEGEKNLRDLYEELQNLQAQLRLLLDKKAVEEELESNFTAYNPAVRFIMNQLRNPAVLGPVGTLIKIPPRFEVAVQTALGQKVQNIVVETESDAGMIIDALKASNIGRATFLPLDRMKGRTIPQKEKEIASKAGALGSACELITYDSKTAPAIESLLGRVLVAENFHSAKQIRKVLPSYTVVTLEGEIFYPGGAIVGGSRKQNASNLFSRKTKIEALTRQIEQTRSEGREKKAYYQRERSHLEELKGTLRLKQQQLLRLREDYYTVKSHLESQGHEAGEAQKRLTDIERAAETGREAIFSIQKQIDDTSTLLKTLGSVEDVNDEGEQSAVIDRIDLLSEKRTACLIEKASLTEQERSAFEREEESRRQLKEGRERLSLLEDTIKESRFALEQEQEERKSCEERLISLKERIQKGRDQADGLDVRRRSLERERMEIESNLKRIQEVLLRATEEKNKLSLRLESLRERIQASEERIYERYELTAAAALAEKETLLGDTSYPDERERRELSAKIKDLGQVNPAAAQTFEETKARYQDLKRQYDDLLTAEGQILEVISSLESSMSMQFKERFEKIDLAFSEIFQSLFEGGQARLSLTDPHDILQSGIELSAQPPGKHLRQISLLSGGEKSMTAIALLMAFIKVNPAPFVVIDEIDAALDDANIIRFTNYLKKLENAGQFIIITHRKTTLRVCERIYGVSMGRDGISKVLSVDAEQYLEPSET